LDAGCPANAIELNNNRANRIFIVVSQFKTRWFPFLLTADPDSRTAGTRS
jgi:hypothetical protein